jgi:hypothetical protein
MLTTKPDKVTRIVRHSITLSRDQIEKMASSAQDTPFDKFFLEETVDGKLRFGHIETVEVKRTRRLT